MYTIEEEAPNEENYSESVDLFFCDLQYSLKHLGNTGKNFEMWVSFTSLSYDGRSPVLFCGDSKNFTATIRSVIELNDYLSLVQSSAYNEKASYTLSLLVRIANKNNQGHIYLFDKDKKVIKNKFTGYSILEISQTDKEIEFESQFFPKSNKSRQSNELVVVNEVSHSGTDEVTIEEGAVKDDEDPRPICECCLIL